jgi:alkylated DNA repair protein alkB homolog 1
MDDKAYKKALRKHMKNKRPPADRQWTPFRAAEKRFKARFPPPDLGDVLDLSRIESGQENVDFSNEMKGNAHAIHTRPIRLRCEGPKRRCAYVVPQIPGAMACDHHTPGLIPRFKFKGLLFFRTI